MVTKLHINLAQGLIEVEGDIEFVQQVYDDLKSGALNDIGGLSSNFDGAPDAEKTTNGGTAKVPKSKAKSKGTAKPSKKTKEANAGKLDKTLDLSGNSKRPSLADYLARYNAKSQIDKAVISVAYLTEEMGFESANIDQIYTCYDDIGKIPGNLRTTLWKTSSAGYINHPSSEQITLAVKGRNWLKDNPAKKDEG